MMAHGDECTTKRRRRILAEPSGARQGLLSAFVGDIGSSARDKSLAARATRL
jgi:hypothetical protein